jgi:uncharacterized repeat protein (TIGR04076 family)
VTLWLLTYLRGDLTNVIEKPQGEKGPFTIVARMIRQEGHCAASHRVGDEVIFDGQTV